MIEAPAPVADRRYERGFSLLELIAVIMITGFVMYAVYSVLISTLRAKEVVDDTVAVYEVGPQVVELISRDLRNVNHGLLAGERGLKGGMDGRTSVECSYVDFVTTQDSRNVVMESNRPYHSDLTEVGYVCRDSDRFNGLLELYRREDWGVDDDPLRGALYYQVYDRVKEFRLEYIEAGKEDADTHAEEWDTEDRKRLPRAIKLRLTIVVGDPEELAARGETGEYTFEKIIVLPGGLDAEPQQGGEGGPGPGG
jgi:prepilin-type N-terminal cleavage/methylation domain-containing protein